MTPGDAYILKWTDSNWKIVVILNRDKWNAYRVVPRILDILEDGRIVTLSEIQGKGKIKDLRLIIFDPDESNIDVDKSIRDLGLNNTISIWATRIATHRNTIIIGQAYDSGRYTRVNIIAVDAETLS